MMVPLDEPRGARGLNPADGGALAGERLLLAIDASTYAGSVALVRGSSVIAEQTVAMRGEREERLMPAVAALLESAGARVNSIEGIVCGGGPGSFTSLRIAASIAKGLAVALDRPLYAVSSLLLAVAGVPEERPPGRYVVLLDAMRGEFYAALVDVDSSGGLALVTPYHILPAEQASEFATGEGGEPVGQTVGAGPAPHARGVGRLLRTPVGQAAIRPVSLDDWEPDYGRLAEAQVRWEALHGRPLARG